jgi:hypothetical protein
MLAGIDVSEHNAGLATTTSLDFALVRASYGRRPDESFDRHFNHFRADDLPTAGYAFGVGGAQASISAQVHTFLEVADATPWLALDMELNRLADGTIGPTMSNAEGTAFIEAVHRKGFEIGLYHSRSGFPVNLGQDWNWIADYTLAARLARRPLTRVPWAIWQWRGSPLDRDWFRGDLAALRKLAGFAPAAPDTSTAPRRVYVKGAYWDYRLAGTRVSGYRVLARISRTTGGFGGTIGPEITPPVVYGGKPRRFAELQSGVWIGHWLDLDDPNVTLEP